MNENTRIFLNLLNRMGLEVFKTNDWVKQNAPFDDMINFDILPSADKYIELGATEYTSFDDYAKANPYLVFCGFKGEIEMIGNFPPDDIVELLPDIADDALDTLLEDLFQAFRDVAIEPQLDGVLLTKHSPCMDIVRYGEEVLRNGDEEQRNIYYAYKESFEVIALVSAGCPQVDLNEIVERCVSRANEDINDIKKSQQEEEQRQALLDERGDGLLF